MQKQVGDVLSRATSQAKKLCGMLSAQLDEKVNEHVRRMQRILGECERNSSPEAPAVYKDLAEQMALHLHHLRKPALEHFQKLIALSGRAEFLEDTLREQQHESMVALLTGGRSDVPRTETFQEDPEIGLLARGVHAAKEVHSFCSCCHRRKKYQPKAPRSTSVDRTLFLPSAGDLQEELRPLSPDDFKTSPEKVVLKPVRLVLRWFEKIQPVEDSRSGRSTMRSVLPSGPATAVDQLQMVWTHLTESPFYRSLLAGVLGSGLIFAYHFHMACVVVALMRDGKCPGLTGVACSGEFARTVIVMCGMACYVVSLVIVLWNIDRLDAVLQVSEELEELQDFKHQIDHLNAHDPRLCLVRNFIYFIIFRHDVFCP